MTQLDRLRQLLVINRTIAGARDYDEVLRLMVQQATGLIKASVCLLLLADAEGNARIVASAGIDPEQSREFSAPMDERLQEALRCLLNAGPKDVFIGAPIIILDRLAGVLAAYRQGPGTLHADEQFLLSALTDQAAITLERAASVQRLEAALRAREEAEAELKRSLGTEQRHRAQLEALARAHQKLADALANLPRSSVAGVLAAVVAQAKTLTGARYAALGIGDDPDRPFDPWVQVGLSPEQAAAVGRHPRPVGLLGQVIQTGRTVRVQDVARHNASRGFPPGHPEVSCFLGAPIRFGGSVQGNLYVADKVDADMFTDEDERSLELFAARAGAAIETALAHQAEAVQRAWLQTVIKQMPEAVVLVDARGHLFFNTTAHALTVCDADESTLGDQPLFEAYRPSGEPLPWAEFPLMRALSRHEETAGEEMTLRARAGQLAPALVSAGPILGPGGQLEGAVAVVRDIGHLKELQLLREQWTSIVAHDLRQPLVPISFALHSLGKIPAEQLGPYGTRAVERIRDSTARLNRMIEDLLEVNRIEARQLTLDRKSLDPVALVEQVVAESTMLIGDRPVQIDVQGHIPLISADPGRLEQILTNLLTNAVKYGFPGSPIRFTVTHHRQEVEVAITNAGPGFSQDELLRLFNRFFRIRQPGVAPREGLGLGLYITKGLVEAHGGHIQVESRPNETTTFRFTLPVNPPA